LLVSPEIDERLRPANPRLGDARIEVNGALVVRQGGLRLP
jgi:hypothetical protein